MNTSLFELFKIGIGPSSSHTVGPMRAALRFLRTLEDRHLLDKTAAIRVDLYGSLALTGAGHATDRAILLGLLGESPDTVDLATIDARLGTVRSTGRLLLMGRHEIPFHEPEHLLFHRDQMYPEPGKATHPNGLRCTVFNAAGEPLASEVFYSVGGGFVLSAAEYANAGSAKQRDLPFPFSSAAELLEIANTHHLTIADIVFANEVALLRDPEIRYRIDRILALSKSSAGDNSPSFSGSPLLSFRSAAEESASAPAHPGAPLMTTAASSSYVGSEDAPATEQTPESATIQTAIFTLWQVMSDSIDRGIATEGTLPGGLNVRRRAPGLAARLARLSADGQPRDPLAPLDSVTLVAMAVNEENAAGGRVVTAPTNGAAGVVPAIAHYYLHHTTETWDGLQKQAGLLRYFLTAAAIGILYKENASISGAEVGCQGEVGVACSMAAGGLVAALTPPLSAAHSAEDRTAANTASNAAVEHAAEIAMEHNLGMTCDPIGGLVQIPCIERNGMGAVKAVNAARLALADPGAHKVSLDQVIDTMYRTGLDMQSRYKETSLAGLALNIIEC